MSELAAIGFSLAFFIGYVLGYKTGVGKKEAGISHKKDLHDSPPS